MYLGGVDFLVTLEHVEDSSLNVFLRESCCSGKVRAVQSVGGLLGDGKGWSGTRQATEGYTSERHFGVNASNTQEGVLLAVLSGFDRRSHKLPFEESAYILVLGLFNSVPAMKHGVAFRKFSRTSSHRNLMLRCAA